MIGAEIKAPFFDKVPWRRSEGAAAQRVLAARPFPATKIPKCGKKQTPGQNQMFEIRIWF